VPVTTDSLESLHKASKDLESSLAVVGSQAEAGYATILRTPDWTKVVVKADGKPAEFFDVIQEVTAP
jgi:hypothetical protein